MTQDPNAMPGSDPNAMPGSDPNAMPGSDPTPAGPPPAPGPMGYQPPSMPPGPQGYTPPPPPKKGNRIGLIILVVLGLIIGGGVIYTLLNRDSLSGSAAGLQVGDCFDEPETTGDIDDVQHVPCVQPHDNEVFAALKHPAPDGEAFPVISGFDDYIEETCIPLWEAYTDRSWDAETELGLYAYHPTLLSWGDGGRSITCYIARQDLQKLIGSVKGIGSSPLPTPTP